MRRKAPSGGGGDHGGGATRLRNRTKGAKGTSCDPREIASGEG